MHALAKFRQYLVGEKIVMNNNHNSLKHFLSQKELNDRKQKWVSMLQSYDFYIEYKKGKINVVSDALSRMPTISLIHVPNDWKFEVAIEYSKDRFSCEVLDELEHGDVLKVINDVI